MDGSKINVSGLLTVLHSTLDATDLAWRALYVNCHDSNKFLKEWELPDSQEQPIQNCSCRKNLNDEPEDVTKDISHILEKAKATREKICIKGQSNLVSKLSSSSTTKTPTSLLVPCSKKGTQSRGCHFNSASQTPKYAHANAHKNIEDSRRPKSAPTSLMSKSSVGTRDKSSKIKKPLSSFQTTYQRDFVSRNRNKAPFQSQVLSNIQKEKSDKKYNCNGKSSLSSLRETVVKQLRDDVDDPIKTVDPTDKKSYALTSTVNDIDSSSCPVHKPAAFKRSLNKTVALEEAIDVLGVPPDLLKPLKTYHQYISQNEDVLHLGSKKGTSTRNKFVQRLNGSNAQSWKYVVSEPVVDLWKEYTALLQRICATKCDARIDHSSLQIIMGKLEILESIFHKTSEFDVNPSNETCCFIGEETASNTKEHSEHEKREWALTGVWNEECKRWFSGMKQVLNIRYKSEENCILFQQNLQKIQNLQLQIHILDVMKNEILPQLSEVERSNPIFLKLFKMCTALCNINTLVQPVLVRM